ncbi:MAG: ferrous iron transporter B, partial [Candidatus Odinarchaeota archaeon]|nr:ferrous iron transporter B [Candidatus Odinarchaeota archaeon]
ELQIEVVPTNAVMKEGIEELVKSIIKTYEKNIVHKEYRYPEPLESYILTLARKIGKEIDGYDSRWLAIRILERDSEITNLVKQKIPEIIDEAERIHNEIHKTMKQDPPLAIISARYETVDTLISKYVRRVTLKHQVSETLDKIVLHPVLQFVVTGLVFILLFWVTFYIGGFFQDAIGSIFEIITSSTEEYLKSQNAPSLLVSFITSDSGILGALDAVAEFFPVILLFYFTFSVIENSGLLARLAFSIDKILSRIGMSGKAFFPITLSLGCTVVGMQATKIIEDRKFKFLLLLLISYVPCSARIGVLSVVLLILFHDAFIASTILFAIILGAFFLVGIEGKLLMKLTKNKPTPFIIELPPYSLPPLSMVLRMSWIRTKIFLSKAGTAIFGGILIVWILSNIPPNLPLNQTVIGQIGIALSVVFTPFGFDWRATVALLFGIFAKENTLAVLQGLYGGVSNVSTAFTLPQAIAFMVFYTYYIPCIASIAALKKETNSNSWVALTIIVNLLTAYLVAYLVFLLSSLVLAV